MPKGYQINSLCSGLVWRSSKACLKYQVFQAKVDSSKAQVAVPRSRVLNPAISGQDKARARTVKTPKIIPDGRKKGHRLGSAVGSGSIMVRYPFS